MRLLFFASALALTSNTAQSAEFEFCWIGAGGYQMAGFIRFDDTHLGTGIINEDQVELLFIEGRLNNDPIGFWSSDTATKETTFELYFDTDEIAFPMGATIGGRNYQAWNADGTASNCGVDGFGFNAGNNAQDLCVDNSWIQESMVDRYTPLPAYPVGEGQSCGTTPLS